MIKDYGVTIAVVLSSAIAYMGDNINVSVEKLVTPDMFGTSTPRNWLVDLGALPLWAIAVSFISGLIITVLFAFDHNISSLMAQAPEYHLKKGTYFHFDFLVLGLCLVITGLLGLPPVSGMIPHSFLHSRSLIMEVTETGKNIENCKAVDNEMTGNIVDMDCDDHAAVEQQYSLQDMEKSVESKQDISSETSQQEKTLITHFLLEQRLSNLLQSLLIGLMCFPPFIRYLQCIPRSVLDGLFIILGVLSFDGNQFFSRLVFVLCDSSCRITYADSCQYDFLYSLSYKTITTFTIMQLLVCLSIFGVTFTPAVIIFPVLIGVLIPLRLFVLPKYFNVDCL
eukprot:CAMPEP_0201107364 /NCGR_PEP_ID=MMETSP0812-20130820/56166_1 /ASSEMBLY_ACC=CAM_ASM_000668 /TAXON_ID=98059 /ORGANISM="Dinobryon sp., Strain UTEXLB2267" /LENGTH=337 /DNA_ID=CAMNT_0047368183 /DNA_START=347 /DNA_END=1356 /DNA_ORIENTATION=+